MESVAYQARMPSGLGFGVHGQYTDSDEGHSESIGLDLDFKHAKGLVFAAIHRYFPSDDDVYSIGGAYYVGNTSLSAGYSHRKIKFDFVDDNQNSYSLGIYHYVMPNVLGSLKVFRDDHQDGYGIGITFQPSFFSNKIQLAGLFMKYRWDKEEIPLSDYSVANLSLIYHFGPGRTLIERDRWYR